MNSSRNKYNHLLETDRFDLKAFIEVQPELESAGLTDNQLHDIYLAAVNANPDTIDMVPNSRRDEEILIAFILHPENTDDIKQLYETYNYINAENISNESSHYNILLALIRKEFEIIFDIKNDWENVAKRFNLGKQRTYAELCLEVLKDNWRVMRLYPGTLADLTIVEAVKQCKIDVSENWRDIIYVPEHLLEGEFFQSSILQAQKAIIDGELEPTPLMSEKILTENCCIAAIERDANNLKNIPGILRSEKICQISINQDASQLVHLQKQEDRLGLTTAQYKRICEQAIEILGARALAYIQPLIYDLCLTALNQSVYALQYLKPTNESKGLTPNESNNLYFAAIQQYGSEALGYIPHEMLSVDIYVKALNKDIKTLNFIMKNYESGKLSLTDYDQLLLLAWDKYKDQILIYITDDIRTKSLWIATVTENVDELFSLKLYFENKKSFKREGLSNNDRQEIQLAAIMQHGNLALNHIAPEMWNYELCIAAITKDVSALDNITKNFKKTPLTQDEYDAILLLAKDKHGIDKIFNYLPPKMRTFDVFLEAISKDKDAFKLLEIKENRQGLKPGEYTKLCLEAIERYGYTALYSIPSEMRVHEICLAALKKNIAALSLLGKEEERIGLKPDEFNSLCLAGIEEHGSYALSALPRQMRSYDLCIAALKKDLVGTLSCISRTGSALNDDQYDDLIREVIDTKNTYGIETVFPYLPPKLQNYELCLNVITKNVTQLGALQYLDNRKGLTENEYDSLCLAALNIHGTKAFSFILPEKWSYNLCLAAITKDPKLLSELTRNRKKLTFSSDEYTRLYQEAIDIHGYAAVLPYYPPEMWTFELYLKAILEDVRSLAVLQDPIYQAILKPGEYLKLFEVANEKHGLAATFIYLPAELKTYAACLAAISKNVDVLKYLQRTDDRKALSPKEYANICLLIIKKELQGNVGMTEGDLQDETLMRLIDHYDSVKKHNNYQMNDIGEFFSNNASLIAEIYSLLGKHTFTFMEKMMLTSADNLNRYFLELKNLGSDAFASCSENISRLFANVDFKNASKKASQLKLYLSLSSEEKKEINVLLDNSTLNIETIQITMRELLIKRFYHYLQIPYNKQEKGVMDQLSTEQLADLNGLFLELQSSTDNDNAKIFFSILKMHLGDIPFKALHQPDEMSKKGDEYMVKMATHNQNIRAALNNGGIKVSVAFAYTKQTPLTYDEHQKQKILEILSEIYKKIEEFRTDNPDVKDKNIENLVAQIKRSSKARKDDEFVLEMLKDANFNLLKKIARGISPDIKTEFEKLKQLAIHDHYSLALISTLQLQDESYIKNGIIYLADDAKSYLVRDAKGVVQKGTLDIKEFDLSKIKSLNDPTFKSLILELTTENRHTSAIKSDVLKNYQPRKFHIEMWDKSKIETLFLGDYLSCCLATTGTMRTEYAPRVFDDAFMMPVIIDETTNRPVCGAWLFFGTATQPPDNEKQLDLIANFFEINAGLAENKELMNFLVANLLNYIGKFSKDVNAAEFIMRPLSYGMIPDFYQFGTFTPTNERTIEKTGGYLGNDNYYLHAVGTHDFYQFEPSQFSEQMQKHIAPEPAESQLASNMTLFAKPQVIPKTQTPYDNAPPKITPNYTGE